jgi:8-oxo-dGTP pyrophosphatase MutT (NUDIX family)
MHSVAVGAGESRLTIGRSGARATVRPAKFPRLTQPGTERCEQVAAVCYRLRNAGIEFLLVKTRRGRWTFPKGGVEPRLTRAQAAALEAFEEAGVHGRIEEAPFARYSRRKRGNVHEPLVVHAYLCEVLGLDSPQEANRDRTWFSADNARRCLHEDRTPENGAELALVVDRAVARIKRLSRTTAAYDALRKVQFEAREGAAVRGRMEDAAFIQYIRRKRGQRGNSGAIEFAINAYLSEVKRFGRTRQLSEGGATLTAESLKGRLDRNRALAFIARVPRVVEGTTGTSGAPPNKVIQINKSGKTRRR